MGAFSVIVKTDYETDGALHSTRCYTIKITIITAQRSQRIASRALNNNLMIFPFFPSECECIVGARYSSQDRPRPKFKCGFFCQFLIRRKIICLRAVCYIWAGLVGDG